jgi:hypothetical protein
MIFCFLKTFFRIRADKDNRVYVSIKGKKVLNNYTVNIQPYVVPPSVMYQQEKQEIKPYEQKPQNADSFQQNKDQSRQQNFQTVNYNSTKINIGQVLTDFQNTLKAIAALRKSKKRFRVSQID